MSGISSEVKLADSDDLSFSYMPLKNIIIRGFCNYSILRRISSNTVKYECSQVELFQQSVQNK